MNAPKVSVIIPVYNTSLFLAKCLESVINQTLKEIEIIVVNDGSTDGSLSIIKDYASNDSRFVIIDKFNEGLPFARKSGVSVSNGDYIYHLDGDDYLEVDGLEVLHKRAMESNADIVVGDFCIYYCSDGKEKEIKYNDFGIINNQEFLCQIIKWKQSYLCGKIFKAKLYKENNILVPKEISYGEDNIALLQLAYFSQKVAKVNSIIFYYVQRSSSISNEINIGSSKQLLASSIIVRSFLKSKEISKSVDSHLLYFNLKNIYLYIKAVGNIDIYKEDIRNILKSKFHNDVQVIGLLKTDAIRVRIVLRVLAKSFLLGRVSIRALSLWDKTNVLLK